MAIKPPDLQKLWNELKRRKVIRSAFVYLAVAWAILEASDTIFPRLGLPDWTVTFVLILLIIIFILVIVLTWVYDITPEGIKVTKEQEETDDYKKVEDKQLPKKVRPAAEGDNAAGNDDLKKRVIDLETQLEEARKIRLKTALPLLFRKIAFPFFIFVILFLIVIFKQDLADLAGLGNKKLEEARLHNALATRYIYAGDIFSAKKEVDLALNSDPGYSYAWSNKAVITFLQGDLENAIIQTVKAIELDARNSRAPYNLAYYLDEKNEVQEARRWYKEAIRIDSTYQADSVYVAASSALGRLYNNENRPFDAMLVLNRAKNKFPESNYIFLIYRNLGNSYLLSSHPDSAIKYLELSDSIVPDDKFTVLYLARAYESAGDIDRSLNMWKEYLNLESDSSKVREADQHMKDLAVRRLREYLDK